MAIAAAPPLRRADETPQAHAHRCALALMADSRPMYMLATPVLEQILQLTIGACHGQRDNAIVASVEQLRREVDATIRRRARLDQENREHPRTTAAPPAPQDDGPTIIGGYGANVPRPPSPPRPLPPGRNHEPEYAL